MAREKAVKEKDNLILGKTKEKELLTGHQAPSGAKWDVFEVFLHYWGTLLIISNRYDVFVTLNHNKSLGIGQPMFYGATGDVRTAALFPLIVTLFDTFVTSASVFSLMKSTKASITSFPSFLSSEASSIISILSFTSFRAFYHVSHVLHISFPDKFSAYGSVSSPVESVSPHMALDSEAHHPRIMEAK